MPDSISIRVETNQPATMRDGTMLYADVYRPDGPGPFPTILQRTPYDKTSPLSALMLDPIKAATAGFALVIQDTRGRYTSGGEFYCFVDDINDGYDTVEWAASQPWSSGRVGMIGASYVGATQWLCATSQPPHLAAIAPNVTASNYHDGWTYQGGAFELGFNVSWTMLQLTLANFKTHSAIKSIPQARSAELLKAVDGMSDAFKHLPLNDFPHLGGGLADYFFDWLEHPSYDDYWKKLCIEDQHSKINVPALNIGGWYDIFLGGTIRNFLGMQEKGATEDARRGQKLIIGPWQHGSRGGSMAGDHYFGVAADAMALGLDEIHLRWFRHWLNGQDTGLLDEPPVKIFVMGDDVWRDENEWPLARAQATSYYLHSGGNSNTLHGDGGLSPVPPADEPPDAFLYNPANPVPTRGGPLCCNPYFAANGAFDQNEIEARHDVLVYSTPTLDRDVEVTGPVTVTLWAATSATDAVLDLFQSDAKAAWHAIPILSSEGGGSGWSLVQSLESAITDYARQWLPSHLSFQVSGEGFINLCKLAVEARPLEDILTEAETASLAGLRATLPSEFRDESGRWRTVLDDWRSAGADLPEPVSVERSLDLFGDEILPVDTTIALAAVALDENLGERLLTLPCVVTHHGHRLVPPSGNSPEAVSAEATFLAQQLGLITLLRSAHLSGTEAATQVLAWLQKSGSLLDGSDDRAVVYRLAAAGRSGRRLETPLTDDQVKALRDAFELLNPTDRSEVGSDVGRAVTLEAFTWDGKSRRKITAHPVDSYLPRRIDRDSDSLPVAAERTRGLKWVSEKYADILRSPAGRQGIGVQRFLRLLGAATAPRVHTHPLLEQRFSDPRWGLSVSIPGGQEARQHEMRKRGATYTLQDYHSPDLQSVVEDIAGERRRKQRRKRAAALLTTLGRAWDRYLIDFAQVESAFDYFQWQSKGQMYAYWLWQVGDIAWLDDESGTPRRPIELRTRTSGNVAIYGDDSPDYLHKELFQRNRQPVLRAIGVSGDPSRSELVDRLRRLRDGTGEGESALDTSTVPIKSCYRLGY